MSEFVYVGVFARPPSYFRAGPTPVQRPEDDPADTAL